MPKIPNNRCTRLWSTFTAKIPSSSPPVGFRMKPRTPTARNDTPNTKATALTITTPFVLLQQSIASSHRDLQFVTSPPFPPAALCAALKPAFECVPLQNGFVVEPPQRHSAT